MVRLGMGEMGFAPAVFWDFSLPEFALTVEGYRQAQRAADYRAGTIAALFANMHRDETKRPEPFTPADFFLSLPRPRPEAREEEEAQPSVAEIEAFVAHLQAATAHENRDSHGNGNHS